MLQAGQIECTRGRSSAAEYQRASITSARRDCALLLLKVTGLLYRDAGTKGEKVVIPLDQGVERAWPSSHRLSAYSFWPQGCRLAPHKDGNMLVEANTSDPCLARLSSLRPVIEHD